MKHLGDITQIRGSRIEPVDCITGGSPCQDLSLAGKRKGLAGERSGLFMEQIRIIKEMREHERSAGRTGIMVRPRYMVWENVPGAFSSNKGKDFATVLEETIRIAEPKAPLCLCLKTDGQQPESCMMKWETGQLLGEYTTRSFGECPSADVESRLSQILEECPHPKYYLSVKACRGILRRADGRGRPLPDALIRALWYQIRRNRAVMEVARKNWERGAEKCMKTTSRISG